MRHHLQSPRAPRLPSRRRLTTTQCDGHACQQTTLNSPSPCACIVRWSSWYPGPMETSATSSPPQLSHDDRTLGCCAAARVDLEIGDLVLGVLMLCAGTAASHCTALLASDAWWTGSRSLTGYIDRPRHSPPYPPCSSPPAREPGHSVTRSQSADAVPIEYWCAEAYPTH